jgi:hypothetical protein
VAETMSQGVRGGRTSLSIASQLTQCVGSVVGIEALVQLGVCSLQASGRDDSVCCLQATGRDDRIVPKSAATTLVVFWCLVMI